MTNCKRCGDDSTDGYGSSFSYCGDCAQLVVHEIEGLVRSPHNQPSQVVECIRSTVLELDKLRRAEDDRDQLAAGAMANLAELQRFREREPVVQRLIERLDPDNPIGPEDYVARGWVREMEDEARRLRDFDLSVKCPSQADGQADDLTPATPISAAKSRRKSGSDAG